MSSVRTNFAANLAGQSWVMLTQLIVVPVYIKLLGIEAYGLMGFFAALQATAQVLDLGLGPTLTREIARRRAGEGGLADARSLLKTFAVAYLGLSALIGILVVAAAPFLASHVIHADKLPPRTVETAVMLMGLLIPVMWGCSLFNAALMGMERQVLVNAMRVAMVTIGSLGAVLVLWLVEADVRVFFLWQVCAGLLGWCVAGWFAVRALPAGESAFRVELLRQHWRFAAGMSGITIGSIVLMQLDKWLLVNLLPLSSYGHYVLAFALANALYFVITPIFASVFPRMTLLHAQEDRLAQSRLYHASSQYIAALVFPLATVISLFAEPILLLWIRDAAVAREAAPIASILVWGTALNGLMNVPYALQLAEGRPSLAFKLVLMKLVLFAPAIILLTVHFGAIGAAAAWFGLNAVYVLVGIPLTHAYLLRGQAAEWMVKDIAPSAAVALALGAVASFLRPTGGGIDMLVFLGSTTVVILFTAGMAGSAPRAWFFAQVRRLPVGKGRH